MACAQIYPAFHKVLMRSVSEKTFCRCIGSVRGVKDLFPQPEDVPSEEICAVIQGTQMKSKDERSVFGVLAFSYAAVLQKKCVS